MASFRGEVIAERGDEICGERDGFAIFKQEGKSLAEFNHETGAELTRELDFDEAGGGTFQRLRGAWVGIGHGGQCGRPWELR